MCFAAFDAVDAGAQKLPCGCDVVYLHTKTAVAKCGTAVPTPYTTPLNNGNLKPVQTYLSAGGNLKMLYNRGYKTIDALKNNGFKATMMHSKEVCPPHMFGQLYGTDSQSLKKLGVNVFSMASAKWTIADMEQAGVTTLVDLQELGLNANSIRILSYIPYCHWRNHFQFDITCAQDMGCTRETFMEMGWSNEQIWDILNSA
jgi:hypothetical protein